jgi:UDP-N-acetylmuramoylalanine--D-glutamate ligase
VKAYQEAKKHITRFQAKEDKVFFAADSAGAVEIAKESKGNSISFSAADAPVQIGETHLIGNHNLSNIAAAFLVSQELGVSKEVAVAAIKTFTPLPHRLQSLGVIGGIEWIDDSISTTPESAIAALDALGDRVAAIILGGQDRGYDFTPLAERLKKFKVQTVILLPESGKRIQESLEKTGVRKEIIEAKTMQEAVAQAKQSIKLPIANRQIAKSPIVLLSPASPSYGMFVNFEDRGNQFHSCIKQQ